MINCSTLLNIIPNFSYLFYWFPFGSSIPQSIRLEQSQYGRAKWLVHTTQVDYFRRISHYIFSDIIEFLSLDVYSWIYLEIGFVPYSFIIPFWSILFKEAFSHLTSSCIFHTDKKNRFLLSCFRLCYKISPIF